MTARQIRRAAERKARKEARKNEPALYQRGEDSRMDEPALYQRGEDSRNEANRANAQFSTGPRTPEGKAMSSQNALKTALTGRTVLLPADDIERYGRHVADYFHRWNPLGEHECALVQTLADTWWRLLRIPALEAALYAKGRAEFANIDPQMVELETYLTYEKQFRNLALQERRLANYAQFVAAELARVQAKRTQAEENEDEDSKNGFEFSSDLIGTQIHAPGDQFAFETEPGASAT